MIDIEINWLDDLVKKLWALKVSNALHTWIKKWVIYMEWVAKKETPVDTWLLRNSYETRFSQLKWQLVNTRSYWPMVHEWHWFYQWNPFLTRTAEKSEDKVTMIMNKEIEKLLLTLKD